MSHWFVSRPLVHHHHWTLTETPLKHPAVTRNHGDPVVIIPQDQHQPPLQQVIDGVGVRVSQPKTQDVGLGANWSIQETRTTPFH